MATVEPEDLYGLVTAATCRSLTKLAERVAASVAIVEVGTYRGKSACCLASRTGAPVYTIDPWGKPGNPDGKHRYAAPDAEREYRDQVSRAGLAHRITQIQDFSFNVAAHWDGPVGLLYIDGDHSRRAVIQDYEAWEPHLIPGSIVVFDDVDTPRNPGVRQALEHLQLEWVQHPDNLAVVERWLPK